MSPAPSMEFFRLANVIGINKFEIKLMNTKEGAR